MKESGILFTKENRDKVRSGAKTQTRRVIKPQPHINENGSWTWPYPGSGILRHGPNIIYMKKELAQCARYQVGNYLYVKEPYQVRGGSNRPGTLNGTGLHGTYSDDNKFFTVQTTLAEVEKWFDRKKPYAKTSSLFMSKSLARTWLEVTGVKVERVGDIDELDALAEGVLGERVVHGKLNGVEGDYIEGSCRTGFKVLWNSINATPKPMKSKGKITHYESYPWDDIGKFAKMKTYRGKPHLCYPNPWTFAYTFELTERN